jgi:hypothetical protein
MPQLSHPHDHKLPSFALSDSPGFHLHCWRSGFARLHQRHAASSRKALKDEKQAPSIRQDLGRNPVDMDGIELPHYLEATIMVWIIAALADGHRQLRAEPRLARWPGRIAGHRHPRHARPPSPCLGDTRMPGRPSAAGCARLGSGARTPVATDVDTPADPDRVRQQLARRPSKQQQAHS